MFTVLFCSPPLLCEIFPQSQSEAESAEALAGSVQTDSRCLVPYFLHGIPSWIAAEHAVLLCLQ